MPRKYTKKDMSYWENKGKTGSQNKKINTGSFHHDSTEINAHKEVEKLYHAKSQELGEYKDHMKEFIVDGKDRSKEEIEEIKKLEDLIGISKSNPFGTSDPDVFDASLEEKTKTDLQNMCFRVGIPPRGGSLEEMKASLRKQFKAVVAKHGSALPGEFKPAVDPRSEEAQKLKKLTDF